MFLLGLLGIVSLLGMEKECQGVKKVNLDFQFHVRYKKSEVLIHLRGRIAFESPCERML